ncbi:hypothetical protein EDI_129320 [Entamoeba dispar SAW760]|uniref:Uncharacterized protein n=1 Tax=Entamoeba dispar (strain ATCC PRA-260 / SAW760) TaxID=370354 RepID=B0ETJ4_ENTDS|nr:uncharacterized protein EDI_129320 [Entamoeba dispar SAW760]EDR22179.1 hypothetical protein EDI_129320 [Entamoeba dispar SAW760]|eukprot:EDR22179.1 hypothetical protein EDI_129320 [Entamoeba dispar SAW760]
MDEENKTLESEGIREESKEGEEEKIMIKIKSINKQIMKMKERMEILNRREKELKEELGNVTSEIDAVKEEKREIGMIEENKKKQMKEIVKMNSNKTPLFSIKSWTNCENDMNWTNDNDFFVYSIMKDGYQNYGCYQKKEGVYCKLRSIRMVFDDETFYRVNNAFYLRPYLYEKKGKTWDDFNKDYDDIDKNMSFTTTLGFTPIRVLVYQCF